MLHPHLVLSAEEVTDSSSKADDGIIDVDAVEQAGNTYTEDVLSNLAQAEDEECPLCLDVMDSAMIIPPCMHKWYVATSVISGHLTCAAARTV